MMHTTESLAPFALRDLQRLYAERHGKPTRCPNRRWLVKEILAAEGGPSEARGDAAGDDGAAAPEPDRATEPTSPAEQAATGIQPAAESPTGAPAEAGPAPEADPAPDGTAARIAAARDAATLADLDALLASPGRPVQAVVLGEAAKQRAALERVARAARDRSTLRALLAGKQAATRPGVGRAVRAALEALGGAEEATDRPLAAMSLPQLKAEYERVVGRGTGSDHRGYLIWKIREALKGRIAVGAIERVQRDPEVEQKVLPIRMDEPAVAAMDGAWRRLGYPTRMAFVRDALAGLLEAKGEAEAAGRVRGVA